MQNFEYGSDALTFLPLPVHLQGLSSSANSHVIPQVIECFVPVMASTPRPVCSSTHSLLTLFPFPPSPCHNHSVFLSLFSSPSLDIKATALEMMQGQ